MPELREAIAEYLYDSFQVPYEPTDEVLVTVGGSEAIDLALRVLVTPGDEILIPELVIFRIARLRKSAAAFP